MGTVKYTKGLKQSQSSYDQFLDEYSELFDDKFISSMRERRRKKQTLTPKMKEVLTRMMTKEWLGIDLERARKEAIGAILRDLHTPNNDREVEFIESLKRWTPRVTSAQASYLRRVASNQPSNTAIQGPLDLLGGIEDGEPVHPNCRCIDGTEIDAKTQKLTKPTRGSKPRTEITDEDMRELEEFDRQLRREINSTGHAREVMGPDLPMSNVVLGFRDHGVTLEEFMQRMKRLAEVLNVGTGHQGRVV